MAKNKEEQMATDDAVLLMLLTLVDEDGLEVAITLNVNGVVVTGTLIGASAYYDGITESSKNLQDSTMSKIIAKKFNDLKDGYSKQKQEQEGQEDKENAATYIHLKNARYVGTVDQPATNNIAWWRGKISSVDGYSFDSLV